MTIIDVGSGPAVVIVPGIQGRWEWMRPGVDALARTCRVLTFSLADEPTSGARFDESRGFDCYVEQVREALDARGIDRAAICGVSYGGLIAAAFAGRYPQRTASLVLVSAIPPSWKPDARAGVYLRWPRLLSPLFCLASLRLHREIAAAHRGGFNGLRASARYGWNVLTHMFSPRRMARRVRLLSTVDRAAATNGVGAPVLVVTGEEQLDRVVPVRLTLEYLQLWPHARVATIERTGHVGLITRPDAFAAVVSRFVHDNAGASTASAVGRTLSGPPIESRRRVG